MKPKLGIYAKDISLYISCVFYSGRIRTLVAMACYSSHRLIMGKVEIDNFCQVIRDIGKKIQKYLLSSPPCFIRLLSKSLNLIGWRGNIKGKFSKNIQYSSSQKP